MILFFILLNLSFTLPAAFIKKIISETRKTRTENKIDPNKQILVFLKSESKSEREIIQPLLKYFNFLTRSSKTEISENLADKEKGFRGVVGAWEILLPFENDTDRLNELERLKKEVEKLTAQIHSLEGKLVNAQFLAKAPEKVVSEFKQNLQDAIEKKGKIEKTLKDLI